jgi:leucyl/phenylalanyl-tRNA---protein transferase
MSLQLAWIDNEDPFPPTHTALGAESDAPGLLAAGGSVTPARLEEAYAHGIFPWFSPGQPALWWCPDPRMVLQVEHFRLHRSLAKVLRRFIRTPGCEVRIDHAFSQVMRACSEAPREGQTGTWIVPEIIAAYSAWHRAGRSHSVETWVDGELVGGLYGVCLGRMFYGESMFAHLTDASKIALAALICFCREHGITWVDCQQNTGHLASLGAAEVPRVTFERHLSRALGEPGPGTWAYDPSLWRHLGVAL